MTSLRLIMKPELAKGFGFYQSKPASAFSPVCVTLDELGDRWDAAKINLPLRTMYNGKTFGNVHAGKDLNFDFAQLIAHAAKTRELRAGTIIGSGTVSNTNYNEVGSSCLAEKRMIETLETGQPITRFMEPGDTIRIEMIDDEGRSIFGAIDQTVTVPKSTSIRKFTVIICNLGSVMPTDFNRLTLKNLNPLTVTYPEKQQWTITATTVACGAVCGVHIAKLGPSMPSIMDNFGISLTEAGILASTFTLLTIFTGVFVGNAMSSVGVKRLICIAMLLSLIGSLMPLTIDSYNGLVLGRALEGIGLIIMMIAGPTAVSLFTQDTTRAKHTGFWSAFMPIGTALSFLMAPLTLSVGGWQSLWFFSVLVSFVAIGNWSFGSLVI